MPAVRSNVDGIHCGARTGYERPASIRVRTGTPFAAADSARLGHWQPDRQLFPCAAKSFSVASLGQTNDSSFLYFPGLTLERDGEVEASLKPLQEAAQRDSTSAAPHLTSG